MLEASGMAMGVNPERVFVGISTLSMQMVRTNAFFMPIWAFGCKGTKKFFITLKNFEKIVFLSFLKRNKTFFFSY